MAKSSSSSSPSPELDLFSTMANKPKPAIFERRKSFRDLQSVISKMNPEIVKSVIENGSLVAANNKSSDYNIVNTPKPACDPTLRLSCGYENTAPMTIFYNGMVNVFDVSPHKAQDILKVAEERLPKSAECSESNSHDKQNLLETLNEDLPITRKMSLQRFLEKRKERLIILSPYYFPTNDSSNSSQN